MSANEEKMMMTGGSRLEEGKEESRHGQTGQFTPLTGGLRTAMVFLRILLVWDGI